MEESICMAHRVQGPCACWWVCWFCHSDIGHIDKMNLQLGQPTSWEVRTFSSVVSLLLTDFHEQGFFSYLAVTWAGAALGNLLGCVFFSLTATSIGHLSLSSMVSSTFCDSTFVFLILSLQCLQRCHLANVDLGERGNVQVSVACLCYHLLMDFYVQ